MTTYLSQILIKFTVTEGGTRTPCLRRTHPRGGSARSPAALLASRTRRWQPKSLLTQDAVWRAVFTGYVLLIKPVFSKCVV